MIPGVFVGNAWFIQQEDFHYLRMSSGNLVGRHRRFQQINFVACSGTALEKLVEYVDAEWKGERLVTVEKAKELVLFIDGDNTETMGQA